MPTAAIPMVFYPWRETGRDDVARGEEERRAGLSSPGSLAVKLAVVSMAAFCLTFCGRTAHFKVLAGKRLKKRSQARI